MNDTILETAALVVIALAGIAVVLALALVALTVTAARRRESIAAGVASRAVQVERTIESIQTRLESGSAWLEVADEVRTFTTTYTSGTDVAFDESDLEVLLAAGGAHL